MGRTTEEETLPILRELKSNLVVLRPILWLPLCQHPAVSVLCLLPLVLDLLGLGVGLLLSPLLLSVEKIYRENMGNS